MMVFDQKALGFRIKGLRNDRQLTQRQLAEIMNISEEHLRSIESGRKCGSIDLICDFSDYFVVSTDYLLRGNGSSELDKIRKEMEVEIDKLSALIKRL